MKHKTTIADIAKQLKVAKSTVSRALSNHRSIGLRTRTRVQQLAQQLNYEPDRTAILFKQKRTRLIGVILPGVDNEFFAKLFAGIEDVAYANDYTLLFSQSRDEVEREQQLVANMKKHRVDGVLVSLSKNTNEYQHFESLKESNIPLVFLDRVPDLHDIHTISSRLDTGMEEAVAFLLNKKKAPVALINGPEGLWASRERLQAYKAALAKHSIAFDDLLVVHSDLTTEGNRQAMQRLLALKKRPAGVIVFNDYAAMDAMQYARLRGVKVNDAIGFVSFANETICNYMQDAPMASVEQFPYQQGKKAAETLIEILTDKSKPEPDSFTKFSFASQLVVK
ncbi:MAG: LacI family DNA-binding transcriptional regulator [Agriterribacter sp.]